jgi:hypothetical protein
MASISARGTPELIKRLTTSGLNRGVFSEAVAASKLMYFKVKLSPPYRFMAKRKSPVNGGLALWLSDMMTILSRTDSGKPAFSSLARSTTSAAKGKTLVTRRAKVNKAAGIKREGDIVKPRRPGIIRLDPNRN